MSAWRLHLEIWLWRHGAAWPIAAALLAAAAALAAWAARPAPLAVVAARVAVAAPAPGSAADEARALAALRAVLVPAESSTASVRQLIALTQPALAWQRAEFAQSEEAAAGVQRLQITVPVSGDYAAVRKALQRALAQMPQLSLDAVRLQREPEGDAPVEARLRFSLWLRAPGATP